MKHLHSIPLVILASTILAACGGTGGMSGAGGGATAVKVTRGAVTSKAATAITVNGVAISTASATVKVDDHAGGLDDVQPGDVVTVKGTFDARHGEATEIEVEHALEGQVDDKGTDFVVVGGARIQVDDSTHFGPSHPNGLDDVTIGSVLQVSGVPVAPAPGVVDDHGGVRASRIDLSPRSGGDPSDDAGLEAKGFVSAIDTVSQSFQLRTSPDAASYYAVDYASLPAGVVDGAYVEVVTTLAPVPGTPPVIATLAASAIRLEDRLAAGAETEVEGYVTTISGSSFAVAGVSVSTSSATKWVLGLPTDLAIGSQVEVEGMIDAGGVLHAEKVTFEADVRITAAVESYTGTDLVLLGIPVQLPSWLRNDLSVALANGVRVELRGARSASGNSIVASRISDPSSGGNASRVFLRAVVDAKGTDSVTMLGYTVSLAGASLQNADGTMAASVSAFLAGVEAGHTVLKVRASSAADVNVAGKVWTADEAEVEGHD